MRKYTLYKDLERYPYVPREPEYAEWTKKDNERLDAISKQYEEVLEIAQGVVTKLNQEYSMIELRLRKDDLRKLAEFAILNLHLGS